MKNVIVVVILTVGLVACGGSTGPQGPAGVSATSTSSSSASAEVQSIVDGYNQYLVSQGSDPITPGLRCTLYNVPNMPSTPCLLSSSIPGCNVLSSSSGYTSVATFTYVGPINQSDESGTAGFNMLPTALQSLYSSNFAVTCTGYVVNTDYNYHEFSLSSDDGSLLYINGSLVVNADGEHSIETVNGVKYLEAQVYSIQINYFQGPGYVALILSQDGNVMDGTTFYH